MEVKTEDSKGKIKSFKAFSLAVEAAVADPHICKISYLDISGNNVTFLRDEPGGLFRKVSKTTSCNMQVMDALDRNLMMSH